MTGLPGYADLVWHTVKATGKTPEILRRDGWPWEEIYRAAGVSAIEEGINRDEQRRQARNAL